jgi:transposase
MRRRNTYRKYTPEFKAEAVRLFLESDEPRKKIARDLGLNPTTLQSWVDAARPPAREPLTDDERSELNRLRRDIRRVEMERDILKKATAFFARQSE